MKLSVIIVNYNVKYFLEQALHAVKKAMRTLEGQVDIFVVDNNSVDGSCEMVKEKFPEVVLIENSENTGFSKANNQAIRMSSAEYVLLLNPDTVVEEDTFVKIIRFMDTHPDAGALGVKMIDGSGKFLPESKRGLPSPLVAFYKVFGLSALFPFSRIFGKYHLGYLNKDETHVVDVLAGAFMLIRKKTLDEIGLLDESFFMYGEDIDLSYRITKGGYKNYYFPETRIIHYKGESTKKSSINYVFIFYRAMIVFAAKHYSQKNAKIFSILIHFAIYVRAFLAIAMRFIRKSILPVADAILIYGGMFLLKNFWEDSIKNNEGVHYPEEYLNVVVPLYIFGWLMACFFSGGYDRPIRLTKLIRGIFTGTVLILVVYALLSESLRFSRALIILGSVWACISMISLRFILNLFGLKQFRFENQDKKRILIVGGEEEGQRVLSLIKHSTERVNFIGFVKPSSVEAAQNGNSFPIDYNRYYLGKLEQLNNIVDVYQAEEIIFCSKEVTANQIIDLMSQTGSKNLEYKIAPPESLSIIGSNSVDNPGDLYVVEINSITKAVNKRNKRLFDLLCSFVLLLFSPFFIFFIRSPLYFFRNIAEVIAGKKSWVGYAANPSGFSLPKIRRGVLSPLDIIRKESADANTADKLNMLYAKDYRIYNDLNIVIKAFRNIGRC
jgi:GT2 family glycosyltransferase